MLQAQTLQNEIVAKVRGNMDENRAQRHVAEICFDLAKFYQFEGGLRERAAKGVGATREIGLRKGRAGPENIWQGCATKSPMKKH